MPNVNLPKQIGAHVRGQIKSGACANSSEVIHAGIRSLNYRDGAHQFYALKMELEEAVWDAEAGGFEAFDAVAYEPDAAERLS